uniref:hypothetical protein n=1 Tax=Aquisphaera insulae TaxID=2712864 RepID=UPI0013EBDD55
MPECPKCGATLLLVQEPACGFCGADLHKARDIESRRREFYGPANDRAHARRTSLFVSILIYVVTILTTLPADVAAKFEQAFGPRPLGLSTTAFVCGLLTVLFTPFPFILYHYSLVGRQAGRDGVLFHSLSALAYLRDVHHRHPELSTSRRIFLSGLLFYVAVVGAWIVHTARLGI